MEHIFGTGYSSATVTMSLNSKIDNPGCCRLELNSGSYKSISSECVQSLPGSNNSETTALPYDPIYPPSYPWMNKRSKGMTRNGSSKRTRATYSENQRLELEKEFHSSQYITLRRRAQIAQCLQLTQRQVKVWFQNRRMKHKKDTVTVKNERATDVEEARQTQSTLPSMARQFRVDREIMVYTVNVQTLRENAQK